ncbi:MAG: hypothetical protein R2857_07205 [Vampirovibrionales bacterium]
MMMSQASQVNDPADVSIDLDTIQAMDETERQAFLSGLPWQPVSIDDFKALSKEEQLFRIRHSAAHIMADAVQHVRPGTSFATGPATEHGFFYDMVSPEPLTNDDRETIQSHIDQITAAYMPSSLPPSRPMLVACSRVWPTPQAGHPDQDSHHDVTLYRHGDFLDLCAGPHAADFHLRQHESVEPVGLALARRRRPLANPPNRYGMGQGQGFELPGIPRGIQETRSPGTGTAVDLSFTHGPRGPGARTASRYAIP